MCILASKYYGGRWIRPPAGGPPRGSDMPPACHSLPLGFESTLHKDPYQTQDPSVRMGLVFGGGRWIRPPAGGPPRGSDMPPACHSLPLGFESTLHKDPYQTKAPSFWDGAFAWWGKVDSNHRRHCQQIYSLSPLATREFPHIQLPTVRWSWWTDSNPRPADYKSAALPAELHQRFRSARQPAYNSKYSLICQ